MDDLRVDVFVMHFDAFECIGTDRTDGTGWEDQTGMRPRKEVAGTMIAGATPPHPPGAGPGPAAGGRPGFVYIFMYVRIHISYFLTKICHFQQKGV